MLCQKQTIGEGKLHENSAFTLASILNLHLLHNKQNIN